MYRPMKIYDAYRLAIETGMKHDPRPKEEVDLVLSKAKKAYDELPEEKKELLNRALDIFYHAQDRSHKVDGDIIEITYKLNGRAEKLLYSTSKGVFVNGR